MIKIIVLVLEPLKEKSMMMDQQADTSMLGPGEVSMMAQEEGKMD